MPQILRFLADEDGATVLEYGLLAALNAAAFVITIRNLGPIIWQVFTG